MVLLMAESLLSEIHKDMIGWTVQVLVSRMWTFRGATDKGKIMHVDLVVLDKEGNHMYAQIPPAKAKELENVLAEGKVYIFKKFLCNQSTSAFRVVESPFMIQFTRFSTIELKEGLEEDYPFCTYILTGFGDLPEPTTTPERFIDVIGQITSVSDIIPVQAIHQSEPANTRTIILKNLRGNEIMLVLWGDRAIEFDDTTVRSVGESVPVIAIFVGTLPKNIQGTRGLSGGAACRWYIDEDIADINFFRSSLGKQFSPVMPYAPSERESMSIRAREEPTEKSVDELRNLDPFDNKGNHFFCTVTIEALNPGQRWWFFSCEKCRRSATPVGSVYNCADPACACIKADPSYSVCVIAHDNTARAEFIMFDKVAKNDPTSPSEITRMLGQKFKFVVSISTKSFGPNNRELSFQVNRIVEAFKPELTTTPFVRPTEVPASPSLSSANIPLAGSAVLTPRTPSATPIARAPLLTENCDPTHMSPPLEFALAGGPSPSPGIGKTACPRRGARTSLFSTSPKANKSANEKNTSTSADPDAASVTGQDEPPLTTVEGIEETLPLKTKRNASQAKGSMGAKKTKQ